jgi:arylsulfatase A-like enzyme
MSNLMDISDWLPTLFEAAGQSRRCTRQFAWLITFSFLFSNSGGDVATLKGLDGVSHWNTVLYDKPSARNHVLHNIDDQLGYAAIRKENWKLVKGNRYTLQASGFQYGGKTCKFVCLTRNYIWRIVGWLVWAIWTYKRKLHEFHQ